MTIKFRLFEEASRLKLRNFKQFISLCLFVFVSSTLPAQVRRDLNSLTAAERSTLVTLMQQYITSEQLIVSGKNLGAGVYSCSLYVNDELKETQKLIVY
jgi:hypothetical protein